MHKQSITLVETESYVSITLGLVLYNNYHNVIIPALAGFQRVSPLCGFPSVRDNAENHSAPMQKAADLGVPGEF